MSLDLEQGDPERAEQISERQARRKRRRTSGDSGTTTSGSSESSSSSGTTDTALSGGLTDMFERIVAQLEARNDEELATALREDTGPIVQGFVAVTRHFKPLRPVLLFAVGFVVPVLAFWRVGSILMRRLFERRDARRAEAQQAQQEYEDQQAAAVGSFGRPDNIPVA